MFQLNVPKRTSALIQVWASVLLVIVALIMSFMPIITLKTSENAEGIEEIITEVSGEKIDVPDKVEITAPGLISSAKLMIKMISSDSNKASDLKSQLSTKEGKQAMITAAALIDTISGVLGDDLLSGSTKTNADTNNNKETDANDYIPDEYSAGMYSAGEYNDGEYDDLYNEIENTYGEEKTTEASTSGKSSSGGALETIFKIMVVMGVVFGVLGMTLILPIIFIVIALMTLIPALAKLKNPELVAGKVGGRLTGALTLPFTLMLFQGVVPGMSYGFGTIAIMVVAILSVLLSTVISRCTKYNEKEFMYVNLAQGASVLGIIGFFVFFFNLLKTNIFSNFLNGSIFNYIAKASDAKSLSKNLGVSITVPNDYMIDFLLIALYVIFALMSVSYINVAARRLSCTTKRGDNYLAQTIMALPVFILPMVVKGMKHNYKFNAAEFKFEKTGADSFLKLSSSEETALILVLVGIIIMMVAEIALIVLKKVLCKDMTREEMKAVLGGTVGAEAAAPAETAAPAEEVAPVEETATETEEETTSQN